MVDERRHSGDVVTALREVNTPRQTGRLAPAATGAEATESPNRLADRNSRSKGIRRTPPWQPVPPHYDYRGDDRCNEAPVKDSSRTEKVECEYLARLLP